jgi:molecular chaperone DnaK
MVKDAEAHAEEDARQRELVDARNQADNMIHATEKSLKEYGEKVSGTDRANIESLVSELRDAIKGDNKDVITRKSEALMEASGKLMQAMAGQADGGAAGATDAGAQAGGKSGGDDIVDAEFEEVDGKK